MGNTGQDDMVYSQYTGRRQRNTGDFVDILLVIFDGDLLQPQLLH